MDDQTYLYMKRHEKIDIILKAIKKLDNQSVPVLKNKLIAECGLVWGSSRRTVLEYLAELDARCEIMIEGDYIWTRNRWAKILKARERDYLNVK